MVVPSLRLLLLPFRYQHAIFTVFSALSTLLAVHQKALKTQRAPQRQMTKGGAGPGRGPGSVSGCTSSYTPSRRSSSTSSSGEAEAARVVASINACWLPAALPQFRCAGEGEAQIEWKRARESEREREWEREGNCGKLFAFAAGSVTQREATSFFALPALACGESAKCLRRARSNQMACCKLHPSPLQRHLVCIKSTPGQVASWPGCLLHLRLRRHLSERDKTE